MSRRVNATFAILTIALASMGASPRDTQSNTMAHMLSLAVHENKTSVPRGASISFTVTVRNEGGNEAAEVTVCDEVPASVATVHLPQGVQLFDANACVTYDRLKQGNTTFRLVGRIARHARLGPDLDRAILIGEGNRSGAAVRYRVLPTRRPRRLPPRCT
jgi:uncharacterized repeat protein (TIGR01451 family)